jgi:hypothetical protein
MIAAYSLCSDHIEGITKRLNASLITRTVFFFSTYNGNILSTNGMASMSPMALSSTSSTQSIFKKKSYISASSYLSAVSEADTRARRLDKTPGSTPALSTSSSVSVSSQDSVLEESDEFDSLDGLEHAVEPSEQVFTTVHTEFGHCANETYRFTSQHNYDHPLESHFADPPYYILVSVYLVSLHVCMPQSESLTLGEDRHFYC